MKRPSLPADPASHRKAFTIVELLVAMSVLIAVTLMVTSLISNVTQTTQIAERSLGSENVARFFFNRLASDIDSMIVRNDIHYLFEKLDDDDGFGFLVSMDDGTPNTRPVSRVFYRRPSGTGTEFSRAIVPAATTDWTAPVFAVSPTLDDTSNFNPNEAAGLFQSFGPEIIRCEFTCLVRAAGGGGLTPYIGVPANINELKGIVVAIAVMDDTTRKRLSQNDVDSIAAALSDTASADIVNQWRGELTAIADGSGPIARAAGEVRLYQRVFLFPR